MLFPLKWTVQLSVEPLLAPRLLPLVTCTGAPQQHLLVFSCRSFDTFVLVRIQLNEKITLHFVA